MRSFREYKGFGAETLVKRFADDRSGATLIIFAFMALILFGSIGLAIDASRWTQAKRQTKTALDAAVLAGGRVLQLDATNQAGALAAARQYYDNNVKNRIPVIDDTIHFVIGPGGLYFETRGNAYVETMFLKLFGHPKLALVDDAGADHSRAQLGVGKHADNSLEVALMLDVTGSMAGTKLSDMQDAARDLVNILVWDDQSSQRSRVALIPFSQAVNVGATYFNAITGAETDTTLSSLQDPANLTRDVLDWSRSLLVSPAFADSGGPLYSSCVVERNGPKGFTDDEPGPGEYLGVYDQARKSVASVKDSPCKPSAVTIQPLTSDKAALHAKIDTFVASGMTAGHIGTAFAWYTLSPQWSDVWPSESQPAEYGDENVRKIAILMTDGEYNTAYNGASNGNSPTQAVTLCTNMKAKGITVYTVAFEIGDNASAVQTMSSCATSPGHFYNAENGSELKQSFRDIAIRVSKLYLSR